MDGHPTQSAAVATLSILGIFSREFISRGDMWGNLNNFVDKAREMGEKALQEVKKKAAEMEQQMDEAGTYICMFSMCVRRHI